MNINQLTEETNRLVRLVRRNPQTPRNLSISLALEAEEILDKTEINKT